MNCTKQSSNASERLMELLAVSLFFIIVRGLQYPSHPFFMGSLHGMHFLDVQVLREDLLKGILYLHSQPPLFNLFLGGMVKVFPDSELPRAFEWAYLICGWMVILLSYGLLKSLEVPKWGRWGVIALMLLYPPLLNAERTVVYTLPMALLLLAAGTLLPWWMRTGSRLLFSLLTTTLAFIVLTWSFFNIFAWFVPVTVALFALARRAGRTITVGMLGVSLASFMIAGSVSIKNQILFGSFTSSTWMGMNVSAITAHVEKDRLERLIEEGRVTPIQRIKRFSPPEVYLEYYQAPNPEGHPALTALRKSTGRPNHNHLVCLQASREYFSNTLTLIFLNPMEYLMAVLNQLGIFFSFTPGSVYTPGSPARLVLEAALSTGEFFFSVFVWPVMFLACFVAVLWVQIRAAFGALRARKDPIVLARGGFLLFSSLNMLYVVTVACFLELGEGCFMRIPIDPYLWIGSGYSVMVLAGSLKSLHLRRTWIRLVGRGRSRSRRAFPEPGEVK